VTPGRLPSALGASMAAVAVACGSVATTLGAAPTTSPPPSRPAVVEADGATLEIPAGALPAGVAPRQLSLRRVTTSGAPSEPVTGVPLAAYELLPDGLRLAEPATLTVTRPLSGPATVPLVIHASADGVEPGRDAVTRIDVADGTVATSVQVGHFSRVSFDALFTLDWPESGSRVVGEFFDVTATLTPRFPLAGIRGTDPTRNPPAASFYYAQGSRFTATRLASDTYTLRPVTADASGPLSPSRAALSDGGTFPYHSSQPVTLTATFFCVDQGTAFVAFDVAFDVEVVFPTGSLPRPATGGIAFVGAQYDCVGEMEPAGPPVLCDPDGRETDLPRCPGPTPTR
jgi:hypothetical protein